MDKLNKITNKATGQTYQVSDEGQAAIQANKHTKDLYSYETKASLPAMADKIKGGTAPAKTGDDVKAN